MQPVGAARTEINVVDLSIIIAAGLKGVTAVTLLTKWGDVGVPKDCGTPAELETFFGGPAENNDGYLLALRAIQRGGKLKVSRAGKYTNPSDASTLTGTKSKVNVTQTAQAAVAATGVLAISALGTPSVGTVSVYAQRPGASDIILANAVSVSTTPAATATAIAAAITASGFSAVAATSNITVTGPVAAGASGNQYTLKVIAPNTITFANYNVPMTGGKDTTVVTGTKLVEARSIGVWGDGVIMDTVLAASGQIGMYDIILRLPGQAILADERYSNIPKAASDPAFATAITNMLLRSNLISTFDASDDFVLQPASETFTGGAETDSMSPIDYMGTEAASNNVHSFDESADISFIAVLGVTDPVLSYQLALYVDARKDIMGTHTTPVGLNGATTVDYREGTGAYNHTPINSWRNIMVTGGLNVFLPNTIIPQDISEIGDFIGVNSSKDNTAGEWWSFAGEKRGLVFNANNVVYNVGSNARQTQNDNYDIHGINPVIQNANKNILFWGNSTLWKENTLLRKAEVAQLILFMYRTLRQLVPRNTFDPNDPATWKSIWRRVDPFLKTLVDGRAIWKYLYQGDQDIMEVSQAVVNNPADIDAGKYVARIFIAPKVAMKYIQIDVVLTNSGVEFENITEAELA